MGKQGQPAQTWPEDGLEEVKACPLCGAEERELVHPELEDRIFFCAPGKWALHRCSGCRCGYLDPRPTPSTIGLAYESYYTHEAARKKDSADLTGIQRMRRSVANGYRNHRFGTRDEPSTPLGLLLNLFPGQRTPIDTESRHLPKPSPGARLLDVGCGDGGFLEFARGAGWSVTGVDFDEKSVEAARSRGLDIRLGGVEVIGPQERFDGITLSHVIEHVHDPVEVLSRCHALLKPEGWIWIQTPNLDSLGHEHYGPDWRGLEPPRHLVLFTPDSLALALRKAGFERIESQRAVLACDFTFPASEAIVRERTGKAPAGADDVGARVKAAEVAAARNPAVQEFITLKAWRPKTPA